MDTHSSAIVASAEVLARQRQEAFELVAQIVRENHESRRRSFGASLKPEMRRRTFDGFDEKRIGFESFREFLLAASAAGVIDVHDAPRGPDVVLAPPGEVPFDPTPMPTPTSTSTSPRTEARRRIRPDLWECFVDWDERFLRVYDRTADSAIRYPPVPTALEPPERAEFRRLLAEEAQRFVGIDPISFTKQLDWMRDFVDGLEDIAAGDRLKIAFNSARPVRAFAQALNAEGELRGRWIAHRQALVEQVIHDWIKRHELELEIYVVSPEPAVFGRPNSASPSSSASSEDERLRRMREQLKRAIDRMPSSELEALKVPYGYTFDA